MSEFIDACWGRNQGHVPVWFMRQAGRYLPSYRALKGELNILDVVRNPILSASMAVTAAKELDTDAAILFADIIVPAYGCGFPVRIDEGIGPVVEKRINSSADAEILEKFKAGRDTKYIIESIKLTKKGLGGIPLLGFAGGPFTMAYYLVGGGKDVGLANCRSFMHANKKEWNKILFKITSFTIKYLKAQIGAGVDAIQLFDSWAGLLSREEYSEYVEAHTKKIFAELPNDRPKIHFCAKSAHLLEEFSKIGCNVLSIDSETSINEAFEQTGGGIALQGNLSPDVAARGGKAMADAVRKTLEAVPEKGAFIFNLGHGVLKETPPSNLKQIVKTVHAFSTAKGG